MKALSNDHASIEPWTLIASALRSLGGTVGHCSGGITVTFNTFTLKSSIRETSSIAAVTTYKIFKLDTEIDERQSFSVELYADDGGLPHLTSITFGPVPSSKEGVDEREFSRRFFIALQWLLENTKQLQFTPRLRQELATLTA